MIAQNGDIFEMRLITRQSDQTLINIRHYKVANGPSDDVSVITLFNPVMDGLATVIKEVMESEAELQGYGVKRVIGGDTAEVLSEHGHTFGDLETEPMPMQIAKVFSLRADTAPPGTRGRLYLGGLASSLYDFLAHQFRPESDILFDAVAAALIDTVPSNGCDLVPVVFRREIGTGYNLTTAIHRRFAGTQRRRSRISGADDHVFT